MSCCQVARSNSTDRADRSAPVASHSPIRRKMPAPSSTSPPSAVPSSTANKSRLPSAARRCTCDAIGTVSPPANSSGSREPRVLRGDPGSREGEDRSPVPEHGGIGLGLPADVGDGPAISELHRMQSAGELVACPPAPLPPPPPSPPPPLPAPARPPWPRRPGSEQRSLQVGRERARHREGERPIGPDHRSTRPDSERARPDRSCRETPMRPINLPAYGKVEACPRFRRTSSSAASSTR